MKTEYEVTLYIFEAIMAGVNILFKIKNYSGTEKNITKFFSVPIDFIE